MSHLSQSHLAVNGSGVPNAHRHAERDSFAQRIWPGRQGRAALVIDTPFGAVVWPWAAIRLVIAQENGKRLSKVFPTAWMPRTIDKRICPMSP
ncbi:MAG: hypothetical protein HYY23_16835 [Verrucomicrobia bacterium]|nr:hypothetical protein [Verrucomicrobiota bacterium]